MAIKAIVDKIEDVEEPFRVLYTEINGKFELTGIEDVLSLSSVKSLKTENGARRISEKAAKDTLEKFKVLGERKPDEILAMLDRIPELEALAAGKLDEAKINDLVEKRIGSKTGPLERQVKTLTTQIAERDTAIQAFSAKEATRTIHDSVRDAVSKAQGFQPPALDDALMFAERHLHVSEDGKVLTKDGVGVTPGIDAVVWLSEMQPRKPHWWGDTKGGGALGNRGGNGASGPNPFTRENWNLTQQGTILKENKTRAEQLAKSAGTTVGGGMPPIKKVS